MLSERMPHQDRCHRLDAQFNECNCYVAEAAALEAHLDGLMNKCCSDGQAYQGPQYWEDRVACMQGHIDALEAENERLKRELLSERTAYLDMLYAEDRISSTGHHSAVEELKTMEKALDA